MEHSVLFITNSFRTCNGVATVLMNQYQALIKAGYKIDILQFWDIDSVYAEQVRKNGGHVITYKISSEQAPTGQTAAPEPDSQASFHTFPRSTAKASPSPAEHRLVSHTAGRMSKGVWQPSPLRTAATFAGISWMEAVFSTMRRHRLWLAVSPRRSRRAASMPMGVAALPRPRKLAQIFPLRL